MSSNVTLLHLAKDTHITIKYDFIDTQFGRVMIGTTQAGDDKKDAICLLYFVLSADAETLAEAQQRWPKAQLVSDKTLAQTWTDKIFIALGRKEIETVNIPVAVRGTPFEREVWDSLTHIGSGHKLTYGELALAIGRPTAVRAAASAVAKNEVSLVIPCHRVVSKNGAVKYHWGATIKQQLLAYEQQALIKPR